MEGGGHSVFRLEVEGGHILIAQESLVFAAEGVDAAGDVAAVEVVAHGVDRRDAGTAAGHGSLLDLGHGAQGASQIGLAEDLAGPRSVAAGKEDALGRGPPIEEAAAAVDGKR